MMTSHTSLLISYRMHCTHTHMQYPSIIAVSANLKVGYAYPLFLDDTHLVIHITLHAFKACP